jgi:hypothetical protein
VEKDHEGLTADFRNPHTGYPAFHRPLARPRPSPLTSKHLVKAATVTVLAGAALLFGGELLYALFTGKLVVR